MSELETLISRYAAGEPLPVEDRQRVERALDASAEANEMLATEHRLTEFLRTADPVPPVNFELLADRISANIPQRAAGLSHEPSTSSPGGRRAIFSWPRLALAASVLIAAGVAIPLLNQDDRQSGPTGVGEVARPTGANTAITVRAVDWDGSLATVEPGVQNVTVGPSPALAERPGLIGRADATTSRPSQVLITGDRDAGGSDNPLSPR